MRATSRRAGFDRWSCLRSPVAERVEALALEQLGELRPAGVDDPAVEEDVHAVGREVVEDPAVVRDQEDAEPGTDRADLA